MNGISNSGTHHKPLRKECEECNQNYHIEGKLNGNIKFQESDDIMQGYELSAMYAMDVKSEDNLEPFNPGINLGVKGTIEGIASRICK
jgi:hypothetical protein